MPNTSIPAIHPPNERHTDITRAHSPCTHHSRIVALTLAAGTVVWDVELDEVVRSLESTSDRIYAVSGAHGQQQSRSMGRTTRHPGHGQGQGTGPGTGPADGTSERTLFALGLDGSLLWILSLN